MVIFFHFIKTSNTSVNQSLGFIEIPLEIEYALINKKFGFNIIGGFSSFILSNNELFSEFNLINIKLINNQFEDALPKLLNNTTFDFIYFDGNHQKEATLNYFKQCLVARTNNSVFIFDDITIYF